MAVNAEAPVSRANSARVAVQKFGTFLSGMIMPNIAAFIAWGFITALFIKDGPFPVEGIGGFGKDAHGVPITLGLVQAMIRFMLPLLIANTGGRMVYGVRGGVVAVVATMGVIMGTDIPMFLGAMIMGPFAAWCMKHVDELWEGKIKPGFEMLVTNFSAGILAAALPVIGYLVFGPPSEGVSKAAGNGVDFLVDHGLLPLASLIIEPAKVLFLNNAVNHGVLTPLGIQQASQNGKSILFLLEANPGPGAGLLLAYAIFGTGLATITGGMVGIFTLVLFGAGLRAPAAPGSIIAVYAQTPGNSLVGVTLSVLFAATTSFLIGSIILRASRRRDEEGDLAAATAQMEGLKGKESSISGVLTQLEHEEAQARTERVEPIRKIVFACDAGMGSSAMGASVLRNKLKKAGFTDVNVVNVAIANLDDNYDLVVTHQDLTLRARDRTPSAQHVSVTNFMASPRYDEIVEEVQHTNAPQDTSAPS